MLETLICLGVGSAAIKIANAIKQQRMVKRALKESNNNLQERFQDYDNRDVYKMTVFLTPYESQVLDASVGTFLGSTMLTEKEAAAVLRAREKK
jgi:hypothetical protein